MSAEKSAPKKKPVGPQAPKIENTMLRFRPMGYVRPTRAMAFGSSSAGPMPCKPRQMLNIIGPDTKLKPATSAQIASQIHPMR